MPLNEPRIFLGSAGMHLTTEPHPWQTQTDSVKEVNDLYNVKCKRLWGENQAQIKISMRVGITVFIFVVLIVFIWVSGPDPAVLRA